MSNTNPLVAPKLLTGKEVTEMLRMSPNTLRQLRKDGKIAYVNFGREFFYTPEAVQEFITTNQRQGDANV